MSKTFYFHLLSSPGPPRFVGLPLLELSQMLLVSLCKRTITDKYRSGGVGQLLVPFLHLWQHAPLNLLFQPGCDA